MYTISTQLRNAEKMSSHVALFLYVLVSKFKGGCHVENASSQIFLITFFILSG